MDFAINGAGMAGHLCARRLQATGGSVSVFDNGRSVDWRASTRRVETAHGVAQFDLGALFFTARNEAFSRAISVPSPIVSLPWQANGAKADWHVVSPGLSAPPKALTEGLDVRVSTKVELAVGSGFARDGDLSLGPRVEPDRFQKKWSPVFRPKAVSTLDPARLAVTPHGSMYFESALAWRFGNELAGAIAS
jgi:hypothetical protein